MLVKSSCKALNAGKSFFLIIFSSNVSVKSLFSNFTEPNLFPSVFRKVSHLQRFCHCLYTEREAVFFNYSDWYLRSENV